MFKIFIINLKKDTQRKEYIKKHFNEKNLDFEFIEGVYGKELTTEQIDSLVDLKKSAKKMGKPISLNEIGCALSHQKIYHKIIEDDLDGAFIFEDDAIVCDDIKKIINSITNNSFLLPKKVWLGLFKGYIDTKKHIFNINNTYSIYRSPRIKGAIAYYIDFAGAKKLIELNKKIAFVSDWFFGGYLNELNLCAIDKICAIQSPYINSTISETRKKEQNVLSAMYIYLKKTYTRMYYYKYKFRVLTGRYKKTLLYAELSEIKSKSHKK